jgi:hypothetical protein
MGAFFTNYQVRGKSASEVCGALEPLVEGQAYVSPEKNGWVTVYDSASDRQEESTITHLAAELSRSLDTAVFGFMVHDSDIAFYWLYQNGVLIDEFNSAPDYFETAGEETKFRVRGDAEALLPFCVVGTSPSQIEAVIHPAENFPVFAEEILVKLSQLFGIDDVRMSLGFEYFDGGGEERVLDSSEFTLVGTS